MSATSGDGLSPRWAPDPTGRHVQRYWDGTNWTDNVAGAAGGAATWDPLPLGQQWPAPAEPQPPPPPSPEPLPTPQPDGGTGSDSAASLAGGTDDAASAPPQPGLPSTAIVFPNVAGLRLPAGVAFARPWKRLGAYLLEIVLVVATLAIGWLIWAAFVARAGQTPAKQLLHLRVIATDSLRPVGFGRMFWMRGVVGYLLYFVVAATLYVLALMPFWDKRNQNIWDKVSDTYVVTDPEHLTPSD